MSLESEHSIQSDKTENYNFVIKLQKAAYKELEILGLTICFSGVALLIYYLPSAKWGLDGMIIAIPVGLGIYAGGKSWEMHLKKVTK